MFENNSLHSSSSKNTSIVEEDKSVVTVEKVVIRRNRFTAIGDGGKKLGFALVRFGSEADATRVLAAWSGDRPLRRHQWKRRNAGKQPTSSNVVKRPSHPCERRGMPRLEAQLDPLTETQLRARLALLQCTAYHPAEEADAMASGGRLGKKMYLKTLLANVYRSTNDEGLREGGVLAPRTLRYARGVPIPEPHLGNLTSALESLRWGIATGDEGGGGNPNRKDKTRRRQRRNGRKGVDADHCLVLGRKSEEQPRIKAERIAPGHQRVWDAAMDLLATMLRMERHKMIGGCGSDHLEPRGGDANGCMPLYDTTSLAITKNFHGSPHVDARDVTFQYAAAFGDYSYDTCADAGDGDGDHNGDGSSHENDDHGDDCVDDRLLRGGELCIESEIAEGGEVVVVDTHHRLARVDGRYPHWVRGYDNNNGDRYSVIWYRVAGPRDEPVRAVYDTLL